MKRLIASLVICIFVFVGASAQIQRKFFGFTLAQSHKNEIVSYFEAQGIQVSNFSDEICVVYLKFGGHTWPLVFFNFKNGVFSSVYFSDSDGFTKQESLNVDWKFLKGTLFDKYPNYLDSYNSDEETKIFDDGRTSVKLDYSYFRGNKHLTLTYRDKKLNPKVKTKSRDEL